MRYPPCAREAVHTNITHTDVELRFIKTNYSIWHIGGAEHRVDRGQIQAGATRLERNQEDRDVAHLQALDRGLAITRVARVSTT